MSDIREICTLCGDYLDPTFTGLYINERLGYGSKHDGEKISICLCPDCIDWLIESCAVNPLEPDANEKERKLYDG